jgi:hypothetical protein
VFNMPAARMFAAVRCEKDSLHREYTVLRLTCCIVQDAQCCCGRGDLSSGVAPLGGL